MRNLLHVLLIGTALAQVPTGLNGSMDEQSAPPEIKALIRWDAVTGATSYNVYKAQATNANLGCPLTSDTVWGTPDQNVTSTTYRDNPNPGFWQYTVSSFGWRLNKWCYTVTSIVSGLESAKATPVFVSIGSSGYMIVEYYTACNGTRIVPYPYMNNELVFHLYYIDPNNVQTEVPVNHMYNNGGGPQVIQEEWQPKFPVVAANGTFIPLSKDGKYTFTLTTPDGGNYSQRYYMPPYQADMAYYSQVLIVRAQNADCPITDKPGGNYAYWEPVTR